MVCAVRSCTSRNNVDNKKSTGITFHRQQVREMTSISLSLKCLKYNEHNLTFFNKEGMQFSVAPSRFFSTISPSPAKTLYKFLLRQCQKLPKGPDKHYKFMVQQSFKQHRDEPDPERAKEIIERSYEDCHWIMKKEKMSSSMLFSVPLATSSYSIPVDRFWETLLLYHDRSHVINRKLAAVTQVLFYEVRYDIHKIKNICELFSRPSILYEARQLKELSKEVLDVNFLKSLIESCDKDVEFIERKLEDFGNIFEGMFVSVRILLPRVKNAHKCIEVVILDKNKNKAVFIAAEEDTKIKCAVPFPYEIELSSNSSLRINLTNFEDADTVQAEWLVEKLFSKLLKWVENDVGNKLTIKSLSLIEEDTYYATYNNLKEKYGENLVAQWPGKSGTDPQKYVFEDLAMASYLICLWRKYAEDEVKFVDCGCGNGLLVYILNEEGFEGIGLDVRRRAIWDIYPESTRANLKVEAVTPHSSFPNSTWLIGNHSDELTPWIPVLALRSSPITNFFLLPCCPHDFSGRKYVRTNSAVSAYSDYLSYIQNICNICDFETKIDKLRIPSTKRTCLVGIRTKSHENNFNKINFEISEFIESRMRKHNANFVIRSDLEKTRNCTRLDKSLVSRIVENCVTQILSRENFIQKTNGQWNKGGKCRIGDLIKGISKEDLGELKKEGSGILTVLKNHRYIFETRKGEVAIKPPVKLQEEAKYKNKPCWFFKNHPDGCLYESDICGHSHVSE